MWTELLRGEKLIDLYAVTRQAIRASVESYSIKKLEPFYGYERLQTLEVASQTLRQFERLIELGMTTDITKSQQEIVALYNQDDCVSTYQLRQWLETLRQSLVDSGVEVPRRPAADPNATDAVREMSADAKRVFDLLTFDIEDVPNGTCQESRWLLAHMLEYFRREGKCVWWEYFRMCRLEHEELLLESRALSGLEFDREVRPAIERSMPVHRYSFPAQETVLPSMMTCEIYKETRLVRLRRSILAAVRWIFARRPRVSICIPPQYLSFRFVAPHSMPGSLQRLGVQLAAAARNRTSIKSARADLLQSSAPRLRSLSLPLLGEDPGQAAIKLALDLDESYLAIQGPPGAGKTYVAAI